MALELYHMLADDLWLRVFHHVSDRASLARLCMVCRRFQRLATDSSLFRRHVSLRWQNTPLPTLLRSQLSARALYKIYTATTSIKLPHCLSASEVRKGLTVGASLQECDDTQRNPDCGAPAVTLLGVMPPNSIILSTPARNTVRLWGGMWEKDAALWWPAGDTPGRALVVPLGSGELACVSPRDRHVRIVNLTDGQVARTFSLVQVSGSTTDAADEEAMLDVEWTKEGLDCTPVALRAGPKEMHLVYALRPGNKLHILDCITGAIREMCMAPACGFASLVRSPSTYIGSGFVVRGVTVARDPPVRRGSSNVILHDIKDIVTDDTIGHFEIDVHETLVDVVADVRESDSTIGELAYRVISSNARTIVLVVQSPESAHDQFSTRDVLARIDAGQAQRVKASGELVMGSAGRTILYRPERGFPFHGFIRVLIKGRRGHEQDSIGGCSSIHTIEPIRVRAHPFRWGALSGDSALVFACAPSCATVTFFSLANEGRCIGSIQFDGHVREIDLLSDHAIIVTTGKLVDNLEIVHLDSYGSCFPDYLEPQ